MLRRLAPWSPYVALVFAQPLLASNTKRLIALAFPVVVIGAVHGLAALQLRWGLHDLVLLAVPLVLILPDDISPTNVRLAFEIVNVAAVQLCGPAVRGARLAYGRHIKHLDRPGAGRTTEKVITLRVPAPAW